MTAPLTRRRLVVEATRLTVGGSVMAAAFGGCASEGPDVLETARTAGLLRLGIANERPFGFFTEAARLTGVGPALAGRIAQDLDIPRVTGVVSEFSGLITGLRAGAFDVIAAGMYVSPARCRRVAFGHPFYCTDVALAVRRGNPADVHDLADVATASGVRLGVLKGSVEVLDALDAGVPPDRLVELRDLSTMRTALLTGQVDALASTPIAVRRFVADANGQAAATPAFRVGGRERCGAFAFRLEDGSLRDAFDERLGALQRSGADVAICRPFGLTDEEVTGAHGRRARELCG